MQHRDLGAPAVMSARHVDGVGEALRALLVGNVVVQALEFLINAYEVVVGDLPTQAAGGLAIHLVLGVVFVLAMRSNASRA